MKCQKSIQAITDPIWVVFLVGKVHREAFAAFALHSCNPFPSPPTHPHHESLSCSLSYISSFILDMSRPSPPSSFQTLFSAALQDYERQTGTGLVDHALAKQLKRCNSVDSITALLQEQARIFHEFRGDDGALMKSLKCSVDILYTLSGTVLGEGIGLVRLKTAHRGALFLTVSFIAVPACESNIRWHGHPARRMSILPFPSAYPRDTQVLQAVKDVSASYDALVDLFASFENFLSRLGIYTGIPPTPAITNILVKIIVELLSTLALATKQVKQGRFGEFVLVVTTVD
jgi:hypothetical protein